ncbi:MAG: hypothetical protein CO186_08665 [Zetaproteobacteria bacterium CG_4_9_14_3_um_filter_49_83]|nr:MAG: hypothetical protein AUJ56_04210 [Zetaproteobacteria bacterium CG1_02_49_23]PIQ33258.1 MAG: hypothetical protein COW62_05940 [Zetaproteobacteria bacterium CG17_big_fil_post_rev_8_21_14_2_50_50_13]PIV30049.1 MAG: hypothetical protein COS35_08815 [Zetaproteobacteria bacterium CG02_land_8_20_14_3_00_50_9]PIY56462.1 MAG: hypothetical protein COZ00_04115 [Zetaproteobacteria bacterium CG_4_10_14_0_8_um_filter_49_80]PJA34840.1 MAG: hypothetical protein CO186_08665 [Zetaproteobacteria bacterium
MPGFSAHMTESRLGSDHQLVKVYYLLDWDRFTDLLTDVYKRQESVAGVKPYDPPGKNVSRDDFTGMAQLNVTLKWKRR